MFQYFLYNLLRRKWFFIAIALMFLIAGAHPTENLSSQALAVIGIIVMAIILFITSVVPLPATALLIAFFQVFFKINRPEQVARSFAGDSMFFIMGVLLISNIMISQKIDRRLSSLLIGFTGFNLRRLLIGIIIICAILAALIGQHTAAALLFPVVMALIAGLNEEKEIKNKTAKILLFALTYSSMIGAMATPSGGGRNPLMIEYLWRIAGIKVSYFQWMILAVPISIALIPVIYFSLRIAFPVKSKTIQIKEDYKVRLSFRQGDKKLNNKQLATIGIFGLLLFLWLFFSAKYGMGIIALFGVLLYLIVGIADWNEIARKTNWGVILIYASSLSLGLAMQQTGVTVAFADWIINTSYKLHLDSTPIILSTICFISSMMSNVLSHGPSVAITGPIFLRLADIMHLNVLVIGIATALSGSFGYLTVISAPSNSLIHATGYVNTKDFFKAGIICLLLSIVVIVGFILFYWNLLGFEL